MSFDSAYEVIGAVLKGDARKCILADISHAKTFSQCMMRLRDFLQANAFDGGSVVHELDEPTRRDGFDVLHDWDGKADHPNEEIIPVDVLNYVSGLPVKDPATALAVLLDYYFAYLLGLLALRSWDEGDSNVNIDRVTGLVQELQGPNGSGHRFMDNAEGLIFVATSHFEPDDNAYIRLLAKVHSMDDAHQLRFALVEGAILASHLRFGFDPFYKKDIGLMRADNAADYPWVCFSLRTLARAYDQNIQRDLVAEGIINTLTPDTRAFLGKPPATLAAHLDDHAEFRELFAKNREELLRDFETCRPSPDRYSPLAFNFNFPHNILKALVVDGAVRGAGWRLTLSDLLRGGDAETEKPARMLTAYAAISPEKLRGREFPMITYDPYAGIRTFTKTMGLIREFTS